MAYINIVTNDEYELPYLCDIRGRQAAADFLGLSMTQFYRNMKADKWSGKYKAVCVGNFPTDEDFEPNPNILPLTKEERLEKANTKREKCMRAALYKHRIEARDYYAKNREMVLAKAKARYRMRKQTNEGYGTV